MWHGGPKQTPPDSQWWVSHHHHGSGEQLSVHWHSSDIGTWLGAHPLATEAHFSLITHFSENRRHVDTVMHQFCCVSYQFIPDRGYWLRRSLFQKGFIKGIFYPLSCYPVVLPKCYYRMSQGASLIAAQSHTIWMRSSIVVSKCLLGHFQLCLLKSVEIELLCLFLDWPRLKS